MNSNSYWTCPHCGKSLKGHLGGTKSFRQLSRPQQKATIANTAKNLKAMQRIYREGASTQPRRGSES
jgi:hypothetical protein